MFPTLKLHPSEVNFHCVPLGSTSQKHIVIQNTSEMMVNFKWFWLEKSVDINQLDSVKNEKKSIKMAEDILFYNDVLGHIDLTALDKNLTSGNAESPARIGGLYALDEPEVVKLCDNNGYLEEMKNVLSEIVSPYKSPKVDYLEANITKPVSSKRITNIFTLEPSEGILKPNEYTIVTIGFIPPPNTEIMATAICKIQGGEEELLLVMGKSSKLSYKLDKNCIDYGNQVFCETCSDQLTLSNVGICSMDFKVVIEESWNNQAELMNVHPKSGNICPGGNVNFKISYFPGYPGIFNKSFKLQLGYLEPVTVKVHGYAVLSQLFLYVPRLDAELNIIDCYKALAWITPEYLGFVHNNDNNTAVREDHMDPRNFLEQNNWVYISYNEQYPSLMDINMAMERLSAYNIITNNPKSLKDHTINKKIAYIPEFFPSPYCVDFGYVIKDTPVCYTVLIYNYGPINTEVKLLEDNKTALLEKEIKIEFKSKVFSPGETKDLYVIFTPTKRKCLQLNKKIEDSFRLSVSHGPIITIQVKAEVTLPIISLEHTELYFKNVYCGDALRKTIVLSNNGNVRSKWFATIMKLNKKGDKTGFFVNPSAGILDPRNKMYLDIYFVPTDTRKVKRTLQIDIESNTQPIRMDLFGDGLEAPLMIVPTELIFSPTLSYFEQTLYFAAQNMAEIPIEFSFLTLDSGSEHENLLTKVYLKYKNLKHVFIPQRKAGTPLPDIFSITYNNLVEKLKKKMASAIEVADTAEILEGTKEAKYVQKSSGAGNPLTKYSPGELNSMLLEYIVAEGFEEDRETNRTYHMDDSSERTEIVEPPLKPVIDEVERKGVLFIFHGAPTTDYYRAANLTEIALSTSVYSIDQLIIESLVEKSHPAAVYILESINEAVMGLLDSKSSAKILESFEAEDCEYDRLLEKINFVLSKSSKKKPHKSPRKEHESKASSEKSQGKNTDKMRAEGSCFLNIASESIVDLLKPKFKSISQLIIESLHSKFIPKENLALYAVLRAAGSIQYISLVVLSYTVADYIRNEEFRLKRNLEGPDQKIEPKKSHLSSTQTASITVKHRKTSRKGGSEKVSKSSHVKSVDTSKKILQDFNKNLKLKLEDFEKLLREILHVVKHWDKRNALLAKPYNYAAGNKKDPGTKESARTLRNSSRRPNSALNLNESLTETGMNLWLVLNSTSERSIDFSETIRICMRTDTELQTVLSEIQENQKETYKESETAFTIISKPSTRKNDQSAVFSIKNFQQKEDIYPVKSRSKSGSSVTATKRKRSSKSSRKSADSRTVTDVAFTFTKTENDKEFSPKTIIYPGEVIKFQVTFCPKARGLYKQVYTLETMRDKVPYDIMCNAVCECPELDLTPEVMFPRTLENYREKASYDHFVYIKDQKILDFGSIIAGGNSENSPVYSTIIVLRNASSSTCNINVSLNNDVFNIEPSNFVIGSKEEDQLKITVKSTKIGTLTAQLYISIKNNPKVESFTLACSPCKLEFSIYPKAISFEKVPLDYSSKRIVKLTNTSPINLRWEFIEAGWASEILNLSQEAGYIGLYSVYDIVFRFLPKEEMLFSKRHLTIRVFDVNSSSTEPFCIENITVHADSVKYNLDVADHIDYGEIKGGVDHKRPFAITNKGKSEIILKVEIVNNPLEGHNFVREYFKIQPLFLTIGAQKTENLSLLFHPRNSFSVRNLLTFVISMVESIQSGHVVKIYKVSISATSFMPSYKLCPQSKMNFGYVSLLNSKKQTMEIINKGPFSFHFTIVNYAKFIEQRKRVKSGKTAVSSGSFKNEPKKAVKEKSPKNTEEKLSKSENTRKKEKRTKLKSDTSKGTAHKSESKKTIKATKLKVGEFSISPANGVVNPNDKFVIEIDITPTEAKEFKEEILINIAEIEDIHKKKKTTLEAIGCEPKINLKDFECIFVEQYIVSNIDNFVSPRNIDPCCIFCSADTALYFKLIPINTAMTAMLHFKNNGYVTSNLTAKIDDSVKNVFSLAPFTNAIEPHSTGSLEIIFKPLSLELVHGTLEVSYNASTDNKLLIQLYGQACLPEVKLLETLAKANEAILDFSPTCVGFTRKQRISFKNIGPIKCKVIVELSKSENGLIMVPSSTTFKMLNVQDEEYIRDTSRHIMVNLLLDEIAEFDVVFTPLKQESIQAVLSIYTICNPYEINKVLINASSYDNDVIIEELEPIKVCTSQSSDSTIVTKNPIGYVLNLGFKQLNKLYKNSFIIRNRSDCHIYKFRFYCCSAMIFIPEVGHLKAGAFKEVLVTFKAISPVLLEREEITCSVNRIQYLSPNTNPLSWDNRQRFDYFLTDSEYSDVTLSLDKSNSNTSVKTEENIIDIRLGTQVIMEGPEPEIITLPDSFEIIPIYFSVSADYCRYQCETKLIEFPDTYVNEESRQEFQVQNIGTVAITVCWSINNLDNHLVVKRSNSDVTIQNIFLGDITHRSASSSSLISSSQYNQIEATLPFRIINPGNTKIEPGESKTINIHFKPQEPNIYKCVLNSSINELDPNFEEMSIEVNGRALPIPFYFELENGSSTNSDISLSFENIGVATESKRKILLVNPHKDQMSFEIVAKDAKEFTYFRCNTSKANIIGKKKYLAEFSFCPPIFGIFEEIYTLKVLERNVERKILLQGLCREVKVYFTQKNIALKPTVPKVKASTSINLRNDETFPVSFKFIKRTLISDTQQESLEVYPALGKLKPQSENDIKITFTSPNIVSVSFHVKCLIEKLKIPLSLHVSAQCMNVQPKVKFTNKNGEVISLNEDAVNILELGHISKGQTNTAQFKISNIGQTGLFYSWEFDLRPVVHLFKISVDTEKDFIKSGQTAVVNMLFESIRTGILKEFKVNLNIMYGPAYKIHINAISDKLHFSFSFDSFNFGYCFVQNGETNYYRTLLYFRNLDSKTIRIENIFGKTDFLSVDFVSSNVLPGEVTNIPIRFHPRKVGPYKSEVLFSIAGGKHVITITGEGVNVNLELCNYKDKFINFGEVLMHSVKKYRVEVYNNSPARLEAYFNLLDNLVAHRKKIEKLDGDVMKVPVLPVASKVSKKEGSDKNDDKKKAVPSKKDKSKEGKSKSDKKSNESKSKKEDEKHNTDRTTDLLKRQREERQEYLSCFSIIPNMLVDIPSKRKSFFDIVFQPNRKMAFEEKIYFENQDHMVPLCIIKGSSIAPEFSLDRKELLFIGVIVGCSSSQIITLRNTGDVIGSFNWQIEDKRNLFNIEPKQGFVLPRNDMKIRFTFSPKYEKCEFKVKAKCSIKEFKKTLEIVLKGNSVTMPEPISTITFNCNVREKLEQSAIFNNNTLEQWLLHTQISHEAFSAPKEIISIPSSPTSIVITYSPKRMTVKEPDKGTLFVRIPDGTGVLYNLIGTANPPVLKKKLEREVRCKQNFFEIISVKNWLTSRQTFDVITDVISPVTVKTLYKVFGSKTIELEGMESQNYKWGAYIVNEESIEFRITFKSIETGEYEFFEISLKVLPSKESEIVFFNTRVREAQTKPINLENPINIPVTYTLECSERNLTIPKVVSLEPYTKVKVDITYTPIQTEDTANSIHAKCEELGTYTYLVKMHANGPKSENCVTFTSELGAKSTRTITFENTFDRTVEFSYKFNMEEFYMEKCNPIPAGDSSKISIAFEPSNLGHFNSTLFLTSSIAGEYIYPLNGVGVLPTPKGPFAIKLNFPTAIEFKNPFRDDKRFRFHLLPDTFSCNYNDDVVKSKKMTRFLIVPRQVADANPVYPTTGSLTVYPVDMPELHWKYYLCFNPN